MQLRLFAQDVRATYGITEIRLVFNSDTSSIYTYHQLFGDGASVTSTASTNATFIILCDGTTGTSTGGTFGVGITDILDYANTNKYTTTRALAGLSINAAGGFTALRSGNWRNTAAITTIKLMPESSRIFAQYSQFALYGIKG